MDSIQKQRHSGVNGMSDWYRLSATVQVTRVCYDRASNVFRAFDVDGNCAIDTFEFLAILQALDPTLVMEDVQKAFRLVGATESLDEELFWEWSLNMFGDFNDTDFKDQLMDLIAANPSAERRAW